MTAIAAWLLTYLAHSTILLGMAWLVTRSLPRRHERWAEAIWRCALIGGVCSASLQLFAPLPQLPLVVALAGVAQGEARHGTLAQGMFDGDSVIAIAVASLVGCWLAVATVRLAGLALEYRFVRMLLARRIRIEPLTLSARMTGFGAARPVRVSLSSSIGTPLVLGLDEVVLPFRAVEELSDDELDAVLAHETAHLVRRDTVWLWLAVIVERALWLQPVNRVAVMKLRALAECFCDDWAVKATAPEALAGALAHVAGWLASSPRPTLAVGMATSESLAVARIKRILDPARAPLSAARPLTARLVSLLIVAALVGVAPGVRVRDVSAATTAHTVEAYDDGGEFTVTLAGGRVTAATMNGIPVASHRIEQNGSDVRILSRVPGQSLHLVLTADGGFDWTSRPRLNR